LNYHRNVKFVLQINVAETFKFF